MCDRSLMSIRGAVIRVSIYGNKTKKCWGNRVDNCNRVDKTGNRVDNTGKQQAQF